MISDNNKGNPYHDEEGKFTSENGLENKLDKMGFGPGEEKYKYDFLEKIKNAKTKKEYDKISEDFNNSVIEYAKQKYANSEKDFFDYCMRTQTGFFFFNGYGHDFRETLPEMSEQELEEQNAKEKEQREKAERYKQLGGDYDIEFDIESEIDQLLEDVAKGDVEDEADAMEQAEAILDEVCDSYDYNYQPYIEKTKQKLYKRLLRKIAR